MKQVEAETQYKHAMLRSNSFTLVGSALCAAVIASPTPATADRTLAVLVRGEVFRAGGQGSRGGAGSVEAQCEAANSLYEKVLKPLADKAETNKKKKNAV